MEVKALIDSYSSVCLMRKSLAFHYGLKWIEDKSTIVGFGATAVTTIIGKITITANVDEATLDDVVVYIVTDASSPQNFLIGRPWSEAPEISYIKYNKTLTFYSTTQLRPRHFTLVTTMVNGQTDQIPVNNCIEQDIAVQANQVLTNGKTCRRNTCTTERQCTQEYFKKQGVAI